MADARAIADHWARGDVYALIVAALERSSKSLATLTALLRMEDRVRIEHGDGARLPFEDRTFDGAYTQHVTMNVADRARFYGEAFRVLKPGAFFALTEHGMGPAGKPHYPVPWSEDGTGSW